MSTIWDEIDRTIGRPSAAPRRTSVWDDIDRELARDEAADAELAQAGAPRPTLPSGPTLADLVSRRSAPPPPRETWDAPPPQMDLAGVATATPTSEGARAAREMAAEVFGVARRAVTNVPRAIAAGVPRLNQGFWGGVQAIGESTGLEPVADFGRRAGAQAAQLATDIAGPQEGAGWAERVAYGGLESVVPSVAALAVGAATRSPSAALGAMGAMTGGTSYAEAREAGVPVPQALVYGVSQGAVEAATERLPVGQLLGDLAQRTGLFRTVLHQIATEVPTEQAATILQDLNEWATLTPERPLGDYLRERPSAAAETLVATIAATAVQTGAMHLGARLAERGSGPPPGRPTPQPETPASPPPVDEAQVAHAVEMQRQSQEAARRAAAQRAQQQAAFARYAAADAAAQQAPDTVPGAPVVDAAAVQRAVLASQDARRASRFDEFAQADPADTLAPAAAEEAQARVAAIERAQAEAKARQRAARGTRLPGASLAEQLGELVVPEVRYADDPLTLAEREQVAAAGGDPMLAYGEVAAEMGWPEPVAGRRMDAPETPPAAPPLRREPAATVEPGQGEAAAEDIVVRRAGEKVSTDVTATWTRPGHVYRGMTADEFAATVGRGAGVASRGDFSVAEEGTSFADDAETAESYVNFGRTDPRATQRPTYLVEAQADLPRTRDGYRKATAPVPQTAITRVWEMRADAAGNIVAREMPRPLASAQAPAVPRETPPIVAEIDATLAEETGAQPAPPNPPSAPVPVATPQKAKRRGPPPGRPNGPTWFTLRQRIGDDFNELLINGPWDLADTDGDDVRVIDVSDDVRGSGKAGRRGRALPARDFVAWLESPEAEAVSDAADWQALVARARAATGIASAPAPVAAEEAAAPPPVPGTTIEPANDGWSVTTTREDGSRSSRWYATEDEARRAAGEVPGPAVPAVTAAKLAVRPQTEARPLGTKRTGPPANKKPPQAARRSGPPTNTRRGVEPTPDLAHAVGTDAGNASMRAAGRTAWNEDDLAAAAEATNRIRDLVEEAPPAPTTLPDAPPKVSLEDVPFDLARRAHEGTSWVPEDRARLRQREYVEHMARVWDAARQRARTDDARAAVAPEFERYRTAWLGKYRDLLEAHTRVLSSFVTGPANFPVRQMEKRHEAYRKRLNEFVQWDERAQRALLDAIHPTPPRAISADRADAPDQLRAKVAAARQLHETMKAANVIVRQAGTTDEKIAKLEALGLSPKAARQAVTPDYMGRLGFPAFELTNNAANIRRMEQRVAQIEAGRATPARAATFAGGRIEENPTANRVQVFFDEKPDAAMRERLKARGFKWAPSEGAWQRQRTEAAVAAVQGLFNVTLTPPATSETRDTEVSPADVVPFAPDVEEAPATTALEAEDASAAPRATTPAAPRPDPPGIGPAPSATTLDQAERVFKKWQQDEEAAQQALDQANATWRKQRRNTRAEREASEAVTAAQKKHMDLVLKRQDAERRLFTERLRAAYHDPATSWDRKWAIAAKLAGPDRDPTIRHRAYAVLKDAATADLLARGFTEADAEREAVTIAADVTTYPLSDFYTLEQGIERAARAVAAKQAEQADRETLAALERQYGIQGTRFVIAANSSPEERAKVLREAEAHFQTRRAELDREAAAEQAAAEERRARLAKWTAPGRFTARVPAGEPDDGFTLTLAPDLSDLGKVQRLIGIARSADFKLLPLRDQARIWDALDAVVVEEVEVREDEDGKKLKHPIPVMGERREKLAARIKDILDKADERLDAAATGATRTGRRTGPPSAKPKRAAGGRTPSGAASVGSTAHRGAGTQASLSTPVAPPPRTLSPVAVPEMVELAETLIGTPQVVKKFRSNAWGYFTGAEGAPVGKIRLRADLFRPGREQDLAATLAHEIGHLVDWLPDYTLKRGNLLGRLQSLTRYLKHTFDSPNGETIALADVRAELQALSDAWRPWNPLAASASFKAYRHSSKELYADAISVLLNDPGRLQAEAPTFFDAFMAGLSEKPEVETAFYELHALLSGTPEQLTAHRRDRVRAMWDKGTARWQEVEAQRREDLRAARRLTGEKWQQQLIETNAPFERRKALVLARGGQIADEADPVFALEERNYLGGVRKAWMARHVEPMLARLAAAGVEQDALDEALFYERIIGGDFSQWNDLQWRAHWAQVIEDRAKAGDRAGLANPLGITPEVAQQLHKDLRRDLGEPAWRVLQQELATFRREVKAVAEAAHDAGLYTDETWEQIRDNETYATFRVIDHLDAQATSRIVQQIGTLKDVASPLTATIEKTLVTLMAAHYNRTVNLGLDFLKREFPEDIQPAETRWTGRHHEPIPPKTPGWELVTSLRKGKVEGVYVPEVIANSLNRERHGGTWAPIVALRRANNVWLRPLFTMLNLGFQTFNVPRDFLRTWKHQPIIKLLRGYRQAHGVARLRAFGPPSARPVRDWVRQLVTGQEAPARPLTAKEQQAYEDLLQAEESGLLSVTFNDLLHMNDAEDTQLEALFAQSGLAPTALPPRFRAAHQIVEAIRNVGDYLETLPKAAVMLEDKGRGEVRALTHAQRAYIRRFVGSPDFLAGGTWKPVTNELLLFSHAILYAWRADLQLATAPKTRAEWWWKTAVYNLGPKLLLAAAYFGALGAGDDDDDWRTALARMLRRINEFDLTNYNVVPLAEVDGKTFYLRLPQDDTGRFVGGLFWKAIKASQGDGALLRDLADVFSYGSGQLPSVNPFITAAGGAASYLAGQNPYDTFRGRPLFTDEEMRRGGDLGKFLKWEADQLGLSLITAWLPDGTKLPREDGALETALKLPILGRWFKVSDVGARQALWDAQATVERQEAEDRHQERRKIAAFVRDARRSGEPPTPGGYWAEARAIADDVYADLPAADRAQKTARLVKKLQMGYLRAGADPLTDVLLGGGSNAQKAAAVRTGRRQMGREDFEAWRREARRTGVLSAEVEQLASGPPPGRR